MKVVLIVQGNMTVEFELWDRVNPYSCNDELKGVVKLKGATISDIFIQFEDYNRKYKYTSKRLKIADKDCIIKNQYKEWFKNLTFNELIKITYGNGLVYD